MQRQRKLMIAKIAVVVTALPFLLWAYEYGPDAGYSNVPRESGNCTAIGCHVGTAVNGGPGSVTAAFPFGTSYIPGVRHRIRVTITDAAQKAWGFQLTARLSSNSATLAGSLASADGTTTLMCASANLFNQQEVTYSASRAQTCAASLPLQYIEHSTAGYTATKGTGSGSYTFDWTAPSTNVGPIDIYIAGNAANGDLTVNGDHIYTKIYTLQPGSLGTPAISATNGVISAGAFGAFSSLAPGSWMEVYGTNLSGSTREWEGVDFSGVNAPTTLDAVKVTIGGKLAFIDYISPTQINAQVPSDVPTGAQQVTVTTPGGSSASYGITVNPLQPGLLAPSSFIVGGKQYVVAQTAADGKFVLPTNAIAGLASRPAKPGETIVIYGVGFGTANNSSNLAIPAGQIVLATNQLANPLTMAINNVPATLSYFGLAPNYVGLYQFNVVVPTVPDNDALPLTFTLNGVAGTQTLNIAIHQ